MPSWHHGFSSFSASAGFSSGSSLLNIISAAVRSISSHRLGSSAYYPRAVQ